ncbi:MAG: pimeloyl-ACP methyl ester esterase BioH [Gammaproteobacteria bacterium]|nr:pimeloyl-ACP methyl ester esterase BioH [Gammaproteobacteria bacterium]
MMLYLLHGWGFNGGVFADLMAGLAPAQALDLPGHGGAPYADGDWDLAHLADRLAAHHPEPAAWLGWSLGGMVALTLAMRHPACVDRLVLVATPPRFTAAPDWPAGMPEETLTAFGDNLVKDPQGTLKRFLTLQAGISDKAVVRQLVGHLKAHGAADARALAAGLAVLRDTDLRGQLAPVRCPALIIQGAHDRLVPSEAARYLTAHLRGARCLPIGSGHAPFLSAPAAFTAAVRDFLA